MINVSIENPHAGTARSISMMVDTGAIFTCVDNSILQGLGLIPIDFREIVGVSGTRQRASVYMVHFFLNVEDDAGDEGKVQLVGRVVGVPRSPSYQGLIGRDFLSYMSLHYDGCAGTFELRFDPASTEHVS